MKKAVIFGLTQFSEILTFYLSSAAEYKIEAYTVNAGYVPGGGGGASVYNSRPVVAFETIERCYPPEEYGMFVCVGYSQMNQIRERVVLQAKEKGYEILSYIHPTATVLTDKIGEGAVVMERAVIGPFVKMGIGNVFWADSHVAHHTSMGNYNFFTISVAVAGNIVIGNNCFFGNNCTIKNGIHISDYTLVGAGCYVAHDTKAYSVHVPARSVVLEGKTSLDMRLTQG